MGTRDALMEARLRAARDKEAVVEGGATNVTVQPATPRGMNTAGLAAETAERTAATCFGSMVEIRRETPLITPLASAMQSGLHKVLGMVLPSDEMVSPFPVSTHSPSQPSQSATSTPHLSPMRRLARRSFAGVSFYIRDGLREALLATGGF